MRMHIYYVRSFCTEPTRNEHVLSHATHDPSWVGHEGCSYTAQNQLEMKWADSASTNQGRCLEQATDHPSWVWHSNHFQVAIQGHSAMLHGNAYLREMHQGMQGPRGPTTTEQQQTTHTKQQTTHNKNKNTQQTTNNKQHTTSPKKHTKKHNTLVTL